MKKLALLVLLISMPVLALDWSIYSGSSRIDFMREDPELRVAWNQSLADYVPAYFRSYVSWFFGPSTERLARLEKNVDILKKKLVIVRKTLENAQNQLKKFQQAKPMNVSFDSANLGASIAYGLMVAPWYLGSEVIRRSRPAAQKKKIALIRIALQDLQGRIKLIENFLKYYVK